MPNPSTTTTSNSNRQSGGERIPAILDGIMGPNTLIHNDYRVDNLLWDGDEVVVLDFQLSAELTPTESSLASK